jgi:two-component system sensor histidine kinase/response regulator
VEQQMQAYRSKFDLSYFEISINISQETIFFSDNSKIRVILNNLFSNSVQFQKREDSEKRILISIKVEEAIATIMVQDNGIGIDEKYQNEVFNLFTRATQKNVGTGLGLYMVKEAVEQMGGKIELDSIFSEGTTIKIELPSME